MARSIVIRMVIFSAVVLPVSSRAEGEEATVLLTSGKELSGEMLSVRQDAILIAIPTGLSDEELRMDPAAVTVVDTHDINKVVIEGTSWVLPGIGMGFVAGAVIGYATAEEPEEDFANLGETLSRSGAGMIGGLIGIGVGALVGALFSTNDIVVDPSVLRPALLLRYCRYSSGEPEFIRELR